MKVVLQLKIIYVSNLHSTENSVIGSKYNFKVNVHEGIRQHEASKVSVNG